MHTGAVTKLSTVFGAGRWSALVPRAVNLGDLRRKQPICVTQQSINKTQQRINKIVGVTGHDAKYHVAPFRSQHKDMTAY